MVSAESEWWINLEVQDGIALVEGCEWYARTGERGRDEIRRSAGMSCASILSSTLAETYSDTFISQPTIQFITVI